MYNPIIFYLVASFLILFAILTIKFENIMYSLLSAIAVFLITGVLFYILGSEYNAIAQIAIYGVAVPIILGLSIMFRSKYERGNLGKRGKCENKSTNFSYFVMFISGLFLLSLIYLSKASWLVSQNTFKIMDKASFDTTNNILVFSQGIFTKYLFAFEITGIILLIVISGLTIFKKELKK